MKNGEKYMLFADREHEAFYEQYRSGKVCRDALFYTLGICHETREHIRSICDFESSCIMPEALTAAWQTDTSGKVTRLAFNLFTWMQPGTLLFNAGSEAQLDECRRYSVSDIFCCGYAPYFFEAIKIRYPEYTRRLTGA
jgi:hypothetical protein